MLNSRFLVHRVSRISNHHQFGIIQTDLSLLLRLQQQKDRELK